MVTVDEHDPKVEPLEAPYIKLYSLATPNGVKVSIALEILGLDYHVRKIPIGADGEQKDDWFLNLSADGRIPVLSDVNEKGERLTLAESGAILIYLATKYDKDYKISYPIGTNEYFQTIQWVLFQNAGIGPNQGQLNHFKNVAPEKNEYAINRFKGEAERLYGVLNIQLEKNGSGFLVGDHISIADITLIGWASKAHLQFDITPFPKVKEWVDRLLAIPEVAKGLKVPA